MRTKQVRPEKLDYEYELFISKQYDGAKGKDFILFNFRTKKVFENFAYKMHVIDFVNLDKREIKFNIEGLSAPRLELSQTGSADYQFKLYDFKSIEYNLLLVKYEKEKNLFKIKFNPKNIKLTRQPRNKFIQIFTK